MALKSNHEQIYEYYTTEYYFALCNLTCKLRIIYLNDFLIDISIIDIVGRYVKTKYSTGMIKKMHFI